MRSGNLCISLLFVEIIKDVELLFYLILLDLADAGVALATSSKDKFVRSCNVFFHLKDLLHTTKHKDALLSEQRRLQKDIGEWTKRCEDCQREGETKQQQLQVLQSEIEENKAKLAQQEMVLHTYDFIQQETLCHSCELFFPLQNAAEKYPHGTRFPYLLCVTRGYCNQLSLGVSIMALEHWSYTPVVPSLFGTRDQFHGRQFFHGLGWWKNGFIACHQIQLNCPLPLGVLSLQPIDLLWSLRSQTSLLMIISICSHSPALASPPQLHLRSSGIRFS